MSEYVGDSDLLESIIKIEPEEFEIIEKQAADDSLESNHPRQLAKPNNIEPITTDPMNTEESRRDSAKSLSGKGNKGKGWKDPHSCCICKKVISSRKAVRDHLENVHLKTNQIFCDLCPKIVFTTDAIIKHIQTTHGGKQFACSVCDYKTARKDNLENHKLTHAAKTECPICNKQVAFLKNHMQYHKPKQSCSICQKVILPKYMKAHMETHKIQKCGDCGEAFESKELRSHKLTSHYEGKFFECHCGSVHRTKNALWNHKQSHNEETSCDVCGKHFSSQRKLKYHCRTQHGSSSPSKEKVIVLNTSGPFICDKCGSKISSRGSFQHHVIAHRNVTFFCDLCPRSFNRKSRLARHMKFHLKLRPFQCDICQHKTSSRSNLELHKLQHGSKKECRVCHKHVANMTAHLRTHNKEKCPVCSKMCSKVNWRRHMKRHK